MEVLKLRSSLGYPRVLRAWVTEDVESREEVIPKGSEVYVTYVEDKMSLEEYIFIQGIISKTTAKLQDSEVLCFLPQDAMYYRFEFSNGNHILYSVDNQGVMGEVPVWGGIKARTSKDVRSEDWKSMAHVIPQGVVVDVVGILENWYGRFLTVKYEGRTYYLKSEDLIYMGRWFEVEDKENK